MVSLLSWLTSGILLLFNFRRLVFLSAATYDLFRHREAEASAGSAPSTRVKPRLRDETPGTTQDAAPRQVLILAPLRNEARSLPDLIAALLALTYPRSALTIGLIDDGSTDGSGRLMDELAARHPHVSVLHNPASRGKANALNAGLRHWPQGDLVMVYDADSRPQPQSLRQIVAAFDDPAVAGAGGLIRPRNGLATLTATYSALERLVHQQVTQRAKDRLDLAPALLGSHCAYRRSDLEAAGGFPGGALLEDSLLTVAFARQGRRTRFLPDAAATDQVPETLRSYWGQHVRWGRGFHDVAAQRAGDGRRQTTDGGTQPVRTQQEANGGRRRIGRMALRLESGIFALGYLDRLALALGAGLVLRGLITRSKSKSRQVLALLVGANLVLPYVQIALALIAERASPAWWLRLPSVPFFFLVDIAAAGWSTILSLTRRPRVWLAAER